MTLPRLKSVSFVVALVGMLSSCPAHARRTHPATGGPLRLRGGSLSMSVSSPLQQVASAIGQTLGYTYSDKKDIGEGPTTASTAQLQAEGCKIGLPASYQPFAVCEGPLAESMRMIATQERALLVQASRCRVALSRLDMLQKIMASRECSAKEQKEVERWKVSSVTMQTQLNKYLGTAGRDLAELLGEKSMANAGKASEEDMSSVTPDQHSEDDDTIAAAKRRLVATEVVATEVVEGPTIRTKDGSLATKPAVQESTRMDVDASPTSSPPGELAQKTATTEGGQTTHAGKQPTQGPYAPTTWSGADRTKQRPSISPPKSVGKAIFARALEDKYRVATYHDIPVYGAVKSEDGKSFSYLEDTELHLVWDIDQSKLVGEGTNDVELVIKCVLWWKEEMSHDPNFVPSSVPDTIRKEFQAYCDGFDVEKAFESVMHVLVRPDAKEFVNKHPNAKWWTFTNKDREVDGQVVRDVSDDDGQVGMYQTHTHEISGRPVVDANKYALQVLDRTACKHLGIQNQERPLIGVRGQRKDMGRVAKLIKKKREQVGDVAPQKPVTIVLIDDRKCDAWGNCQANDERFLCHIPAYNAVSAAMGKELVTNMSKILPTETLKKFYCAFRDADPTHALIQCVDIMSDDQSMLLKKTQSKDGQVLFVYKPKVLPDDHLPPPLPIFEGAIK